MSTLISTNPGKNYRILGKVKVSTDNEIKLKVHEAHLAQDHWKEIGVSQRIPLLREIAQEIKKQKEKIAKLATAEMGMPITQSRFDVDSALEYFNWYLDNASKYLAPETTYEDKKTIHQVFHEPIGVAAVIVPWNFPISNFVWGVIQNLVVGNTVVFKHSEECPLFGKFLEKIFDQSHLPKGVFTEVYGAGDTGDKLVHEEIDLIWFTGSSKIGKYLYQVGAKKFIKVLLELGGSAPGIIFEDGDLDSNLEIIYTNRFTNCGQMCDALKRLIVHESRFDEVVIKFKKLLQSKKVTDPEDETTDIGPLVAERQLVLLESQVHDALKKGAKLITGGKRPKNLFGAYYEPTILTNVNNKMRVWQEEVFGPVLPVVSFKTEKEAVRLANDTKYGLGSYVYTKDKNRALRIASQVKAGMVSVNSAYYIKPCNPFGGYKESGIGREHGKHGLRELTQVKIISREK